MKCAFCNEEMETYESNNPYPFFNGGDERVCRDCNTFVTAARMSVAKESIPALEEFLKLSFGLRRASKEAFAQFMKGVKKDE